jgi:cytochrome c553
MKKVMFVLLCVLVMSVFAAAQTFVPTQDVLGAHNNGGRGCAGCHQPHSGAGGAGGNAITGQTQDKTESGDDALFGQDIGPLYGQTLVFGKGYTEIIPANVAAGSDEVMTIAACLACHDGSVAKGAMMTGQAYEQRMGLLPASYGNNVAIPTLLAADGWGTGYENDHPVGTAATLGAASLVKTAADVSKLNIVMAGGKITSVTPAGQYATFVANYGMPAIAGTPWAWGVANPAGNNDPSKLYLTCTTCHNQHVMNVYKGVGLKGAAASASASGTFKTYFFVNAPYNVDAFNQGNVNSGGTFTNKASSAAQFCRQCHFSEANEYFGLSLPTAF